MWRLAELVPTADPAVALPWPAATAPGFISALAEHLENTISERSSWRPGEIDRVQAWARAQWPEADVMMERDDLVVVGLPAEADWPPSEPPSGWGPIGPRRLRLTEAGARALAILEARAASVEYWLKGELPAGFTPPADVPVLLLRPLSAGESAVLRSNVGREPPRPELPEVECDPESADGQAWRRWRVWRLRRNNVAIAYAWSGVVFNGETHKPSEFVDRLHRAGFVEAAAELVDEAAQHIIRLTHLTPRQKKGCAG